MPARRCVFILATLLLMAVASCTGAQRPHSATPGARVMLDAHNAYPYNGRFGDRIDRVLATRLPVAIEQDLVWRPGADGKPGRSIVSHGEPFDGNEPSLREYFFERIRPIVEKALREGNPADWPLITLNLDLKTNEPEHHRALWDLLGTYEPWLTTAVRTPDGSRPAPLDVKPVLVLTGESDAQAVSFHDEIPAGARLRLFGAMPIGPAAADAATRDRVMKQFWTDLPRMTLPRATNYRRWWNAPWSVVEFGGQAQAADWTPEDMARLRTLVDRAHKAGLFVRMWTVNGHPPADEKEQGWSPGYNVGGLGAAQQRWRAAVEAGVDFIATDQYEAFAKVLVSTRSM